MRRSIAAAAVAASVTVGGLAGAMLGAPGLAGAVESATNAAGWVEDTLAGLVDDGTLTQEQADAVATALEEARPERGPGHHGPARHMHLATAAEAIGITDEELRTALQAGDTVAEVAAANDVDVHVVIDAIVAEHQERLAAAVAEGELTQEEADERLANAEERATAFVNGELPERGPRGPMGDSSNEDDADSDADASAS